MVRLAPPASYQRSTPTAVKATAAPRCISGRTSYLHVRLIFHPYPQLIRAFCNRHRFGPPRPVTGASTWPWVAHVVSGQRDATKRACHTRFRCGSDFACLSLATPRYSPDHTPKGTQLERQALLPRHVGARFQGLFHSPRRGAFHRSLTVLCAIGRSRYLALGGWSPQLPPGFRVSRRT